jgi:hypothetical protein
VSSFLACILAGFLLSWRVFRGRVHVLQGSFSDLFRVIPSSYFCTFLSGLLASFWALSGFYFLLTLPMIGSCLRHLQNVIWFSSDE